MPYRTISEETVSPITSQVGKSVRPDSEATIRKSMVAKQNISAVSWMYKRRMVLRCFVPSVLFSFRWPPM